MGGFTTARTLPWGNSGMGNKDIFFVVRYFLFDAWTTSSSSSSSSSNNNNNEELATFGQSVHIFYNAIVVPLLLLPLA